MVVASGVRKFRRGSGDLKKLFFLLLSFFLFLSFFSPITLLLASRRGATAFLQGLLSDAALLPSCRTLSLGGNKVQDKTAVGQLATQLSESRTGALQVHL
jgi:hypothetical protein